MLHRLVRDGELSQIMADHLWLDFNLSEHLAIIYSNNGASHLWDHHHVPKMSLDNIWLLVNWGFLLLLAEFLDEGHGLALQSSGELTPDSAGEELHKSLVVHVQKLVQIDTTVGELTEGPLLLQLSSIISHDDFRVLSLVEVNQAILAWSKTTKLILLDSLLQETTL